MVQLRCAIKGPPWNTNKMSQREQKVRLIKFVGSFCPPTAIDFVLLQLWTALSFPLYRGTIAHIDHTLKHLYFISYFVLSLLWYSTFCGSGISWFSLFDELHWISDPSHTFWHGVTVLLFFIFVRQTSRFLPFFPPVWLSLAIFTNRGCVVLLQWRTALAWREGPSLQHITPPHSVIFTWWATMKAEWRVWHSGVGV